MADIVDIEIRDKLGNWRRFSTVPNEVERVRKALEVASKHPQATHAENIRVIEQGSEQEVRIS